MQQELYDLIDWSEVEAVVYSDEDKPHDILGPHSCEYGTVVHAFFPDAKEVKLVVDATEFEMEQVDEQGFFSVLLSTKELSVYHYAVTYENSVVSVEDPYRFPLQLQANEMELFSKGIHYTVYDMLGAHVKTIDGVKGVLFAVWAPNALRASVVGDFNSTAEPTSISSFLADNARIGMTSEIAEVKGDIGPTLVEGAFTQRIPYVFDYIFVTKDLVSTRYYSAIDNIKDGKYPSDHLPVVAEIEI